MSAVEWVKAMMSGCEPRIEYLTPKRFTEPPDEKVLLGEIGAAIDELNQSAKDFSSSKGFSKEYLELITQVKGHVVAKHWTDAQRSIWEATFLVNRALEAKGASALRRRVAVYAVLWLLGLLVAGIQLRRMELDAAGSFLFGFAYWRYLLMGALGGVTIVIWGLIKHTTDLDFDTHYAAWYYFKPILGAVMGLVAVLIILGGFLAVQGTTTPGSPLPLYIVAFLAGFSERFSIRIIDRVMTSIFGGEPTPPPARPAVPPTPPPTPPGEAGKPPGA